MGSLDANYALLSDVSARNRALQARLRGSLPLLWTDNALVMTSVAPRRRRAGLQPEQSAASEADQMLLALEGQAGLQVSRRYKRRVEWEVARRIARVDRELQQYPPAQRFWNQKRKEETPSRPSLYRQRAKGGEGAIGRRNSQDVVEGRREEDSGERTTGVKTARARTRYSSYKEVQKAWEKPRLTSGDEKKQVKNVATSPLPIERGDIEDKENVMPNAGATALPGWSGVTKKEALWNDPDTTQPTSTKLMDDLQADEVKEEEDNDTDEHVDAPDSKSKTEVVPSLPVEAEHDTTPQASSIPPENFVINGRTEVLANGNQANDVDVASVIDDSSPLRRKPQTEDRPSSSIGRQVLSDFRTMPSVASFGARPIISADGLGLRSNTRLNADVLRRLFSDLDTDKDGHVNRIETCMALHRLQISVSTAKIISFFRHIHSPAEGQAVRSRNTHHLPMKEVINYKEFVAFVTAAYDQQQQKRSQHRGSPVRNARNDDQDNALPLPAPSTSMPIYSRQTVSPRAKTSTRAHTPLPEREQDVRVYEMPDADHEPNVLEERVIREIPDLLVSRMLSETTNEAANEATASVVRKSLESLVGNGSVDDRTVKEITQELIRERLRNIGPFNQHDEEDVTGLRRAAAYYNEQMAQGDFESSSVADGSSSEDLRNWVEVLTEEQVSGLVQRIWKDKQASLHYASIGAVEDSNIEDPRTDIPKDQTVSRIDEATDTSELEVSRVAILSEKAIQASGDNDQGEPTTILEPVSEIVPEKNQGEDAVSSTATMSRSNPTQTQLARAIGTSFDPSGNSHELFRAVTSIQILQQLRQQRRTHRVMLDSPSGDEAVTRFREPNVANRNCDISAVRMDPPMKTPLLSSEVDLESVASRSDITDQSHQHSQEEHGFLPLPNTEPVPLTEKFLDVGGSVSNVSSHEFLVRGSISTSSSALSSTSDNHHLHGMYQEIDHLQHYTRSAPRRQRPRRCRRALSASGSSVPDSLCSAELSEGEISRDEATELSDGEIYGESKRNYVKRKNAIRGTMKSPDDEISLHNSVESGELPSMIEETHAGFRRQLVAQSVTSSVESGEIEDGTVPG